MKRYCVMAINGYGDCIDRFDTDKPSSAVNRWLSYNKRFPMMVGILCGTKEDCIALYNEFVRNHNKYYDKYWYHKDFPYNYTKMRDLCNKYATGILSFNFKGKPVPNGYDTMPVFKPGGM